MGYCYFSKEGSKVIITDLVFYDYDSGKFLLTKLLSLFNEGCISNIVFNGNFRNPVIKNTFFLLGKYGFFKYRSKTSFVIKLLKNVEKSKFNKFYNVDNWCITDLYREGIKRVIEKKLVKK